MNKEKSIVGTGILLTLIGVGDAGLLGWSTGFSQGLYFWFTHLAVTAMGIALLLRDRALVIAFLSAALVPMGAYLAEHCVAVFGGPHLFGLTDFLYNAGLNGGVFLLGHAHFFFWPAAVMGWFWLKSGREEWKRTVAYIAAFHLIVWPASYALFPAHQNINCVHGPCFAWAQGFSAWAYRTLYIGTLILANVLVAWGIQNWKMPKGNKFERRSGHALAGVAVFFALVTARDCFRWTRQPHFRCQAPYEDEHVRIGCDYTSEWGPDKMMLAYSVFNKAKEPRFCTSRISMNGDEKPLHEDIWAEPGANTEIWVVLPNPAADINARLLARCQD